MLVGRDKIISVIVPVYNIKDYIEKCIESLISQTYRNIEIILVDDGSTDGSGDICDKYAEIDKRITVLHKENGGLSDARNYGIDRAHGSLLAFVDGDDWLHPQMYELMTSVMESNTADIVTCWYEQLNEDFARQRYRQEELSLKILTGAEALSDIEIPLVVAWNKLYKKEIFSSIRYPKGRLHEDEYAIHRILYQCNIVVVIDKPLYFYTIRSDSIVARMTPKRIHDSLEAFADRVAFADEMGWGEVMPAVVKRYCDYCIDRYMDIRNGVYEVIDNSYLDILWRSERDMVQKYIGIELDKSYKCFAKSPKQYDRLMMIRSKKKRFRNLLKHDLVKRFKERLW